MCTVSHTHKHVHQITCITNYQIVENLLQTSKQSLIYWQVCFVDTKLCGLSKKVKILVSSNYEYFFLTCLYRGQSSKKCFSSKSTIFLQWKQNLFSLGMVMEHYT